MDRSEEGEANLIFREDGEQKFFEGDPGPLSKRRPARLCKQPCQACSERGTFRIWKNLRLCRTCWDMTDHSESSDRGRLLSEPTDEIRASTLLLQSFPRKRKRKNAEKEVGTDPRVATIGGSPDMALEIGSSEEDGTCEGGEGESSPDAVVTSSHGRGQAIRREGLRRTAQRRLLSTSFTYPSRSDDDQVEVRGSDLRCLAPFQYLNDTIIYFYIKYIQNTLEESRRDWFLFCNSFFFEKLSNIFERNRSGDFDKSNALSKLRKWTQGQRIFQKSYMIIPIHDSLHWSLAIICFPPKGSKESEPKKWVASLLHLDSLATGHNSTRLFRVLRSYLAAELAHEAEQKSADPKLNGTKHGKFESRVPAHRVRVPQQENEFDCGCYLLYYLELFVNTVPETYLHGDRHIQSMFGRKWFPPQEASGLRWRIQELVEQMLEASRLEVSDVPANNRQLEAGPSSSFIESRGAKGSEVVALWSDLHSDDREPTLLHSSPEDQTDRLALSGERGDSEIEVRTATQVSAKLGNRTDTAGHGAGEAESELMGETSVSEDVHKSSPGATVLNSKVSPLLSDNHQLNDPCCEQEGDDPPSSMSKEPIELVNCTAEHVGESVVDSADSFFSSRKKCIEQKADDPDLSRKKEQTELITNSSVEPGNGVPDVSTVPSNTECELEASLGAEVHRDKPRSQLGTTLLDLNLSPVVYAGHGGVPCGSSEQEVDDPYSWDF